MAPFPSEDPPGHASTVRSDRSDPALVWAGGVRVESHHSPSLAASIASVEPDNSVAPDPPSFLNAPASQAGSGVSEGSVVRRSAACARFEEQARARRETLEREEHARWAREEARLKAEDLQSELAHGVSAPLESAADAEPEVLRRKMEQARAEACRYEELYARRTGSIPPQAKVDPAFVPARRATSSPPVQLTVKLKVKEPKAWTGKFDYQERENWARSVTLYLGSHGVALDTAIGESTTPEIFYAIRSLFSAETGNDGIAPQLWFDASNARVPFLSLRAVLDAVAAHWTDDAAAEKAFSAYRNTRQGALRARDYGARVDALATACMDRFISDVDRKSTFLVGLHSNVLEFVKTQIASRKALGLGEPNFADVVNIAAQMDSLPSFRFALVVVARRQAAFQLAQGRPRVAAEVPVGSKNDWHDPKAPATSGDMRCYNCGEVGRHWSKACTKSRKDPDVIIIAALQRMSMGKSPLSQSSSPATSDPVTSDVNVATEGSPSSDSSGNGDDA
ncbi:hypothetical protein JCM10450v2_001653 [Rhodotorula kratochvilovae]